MSGPCVISSDRRASTTAVDVFVVDLLTAVGKEGTRQASALNISSHQPQLVHTQPGVVHVACVMEAVRQRTGRPEPLESGQVAYSGWIT